MQARSLLLCALTLLVALTATYALERGCQREVSAARDGAAANAATGLQAVLKQRLRKLADQAAQVAALDQLRLGMSTDSQTVENQIFDEGLGNLRSTDAFAVVRLNPQRVRGIDWSILHGLDGLSVEALHAAPVVEAALGSADGQPSVALLPLPLGVVLVAVAPAASRDHAYRGYVLIGEKLTTPLLHLIAAATHSGLLLSDGRRPGTFAGASETSPGAEALLTSAVGAESRWTEATFTDRTGAEAARAVALGPGRYVWVDVSAAVEVNRVEAATKWNLAIVWSLFLVTCGGILLWRRQPPAPAPVPQHGTPPPQRKTGAPEALNAAPVGAARFNTDALFPDTSARATGLTPPRANDPSIFGRYRLLSLLGSGGMAEVWTAVTFGAEGFRRLFVVKRIRRDMIADAELVEQFVDEARLASELVHSNIVPVFDFGNVNGEYYLAQEYIAGRDVARLTAALGLLGRTLDPSLALYILTETLKALDYAHTLRDKTGRELGIVHRDVSPNNILCSLRGEVKLIDFGIAKSVTKIGQTELGKIKGNLRFMSPEQARGAPLDRRTDLFSLGMVVFSTQTGSSLYTASAPYDLIRLAGAGPQEDDLARINALPAPLNGLLRKVMALDPAERYPSAQVFLEEALPFAPAEGARRLAALVAELFGGELLAQDQSLNLELAGFERVATDEASLQRPRVAP